MHACIPCMQASVESAPLCAASCTRLFSCLFCAKRPQSLLARAKHVSSIAYTYFSELRAGEANADVVWDVRG